MQKIHWPIQSPWQREHVNSWHKNNMHSFLIPVKTIFLCHGRRQQDLIIFEVCHTVTINNLLFIK